MRKNSSNFEAPTTIERRLLELVERLLFQA